MGLKGSVRISVRFGLIDKIHPGFELAALQFGPKITEKEELCRRRLSVEIDQ
jgi:hypothetical protein